MEEKKRISSNLVVNKDVYFNFRDNCKKKGLLMNIVFEIFMQEFIDGDIKLEIFKNKLVLVDKDFDISKGIQDIETRGTSTNGSKNKNKYNFTTTLDKEIYEKFIHICSENYNGISASIITETFLNQFNLNDFALKLDFCIK